MVTETVEVQMYDPSVNPRWVPDGCPAATETVNAVDGVAEMSPPVDVVEVEPNRFGDFKTAGLRIDYKVGDTQGLQTFDGFIIHIVCGPTSSPCPSLAT